MSIKENKQEKSEHRWSIYWPPRGFTIETAILRKASLKSKAWKQKYLISSSQEEAGTYTIRGIMAPSCTSTQ